MEGESVVSYPRPWPAVIVFVILALSCHGGEDACSPTDPTCGSVPASPARTLNVPYVPQRTPVWCWAAVSEMVLRYYGNPADQCQVVSVYTGRNCCAFGVGDAFCAVAA